MCIVYVYVSVYVHVYVSLRVISCNISLYTSNE
jgi:hypothetical protein